MTVSEQLHRSLFVIWQDPESRRWHPVGRLTKNDREYRFEYINGASEAPSFTPFSGMRELDRVFVSDTLFPLFANRVIAAVATGISQSDALAGIGRGMEGQI